MSASRKCCHTLCTWIGLDIVFVRCSDKPLLHVCWNLCFRSYFAPVHSARAPIMTRSLTFFALCAGNEDGCPWKQARGASLDTDGGRRCPFCDRASLRAAMASRNGQEVTSALRMIGSASAELYIAALGAWRAWKGHSWPQISVPAWSATSAVAPSAPCAVLQLHPRPRLLLTPRAELGRIRLSCRIFCSQELLMASRGCEYMSSRIYPYLARVRRVAKQEGSTLPNKIWHTFGT